MDSQMVYEDIAKRTNGDIYIGVVGPVRTGKSTFIKQFMENMVIPRIENVYMRERARDELPQSGSGKTIMTAEPKFIPEEAVGIKLGQNATMNVRMIDCVGYMVRGAIGQLENDMPRMVTTPWFDYEIPMAEAAEIGTRKVIAEHSTIGIVVTTDGTITDIPRESYIEPEGRVITELQELKKPFLVLINSADPCSDRAQAVKNSIEEKYGISAMPVNCQNLRQENIENIIESLLYEFQVREFVFQMPGWIQSLPAGHPIKESVYAGMLENSKAVKKIGDAQKALKGMENNAYIDRCDVTNMNLGEGVVVADLLPKPELFYKTVQEYSGFEIQDESDILPLLHDLAGVKHEYDRISGAMDQVRQTGYGIVMPTINELKLEDPEIVKQGGKFGVKLKASAPSIHMIRADIETEISPIVGSEKQSEELVRYLLSEFDSEPGKIWKSNIFGKSLNELVSEGLNNKLNRMPDDARMKLQETLQRIINEGGGGLICIIL